MVFNDGGRTTVESQRATVVAQALPESNDRCLVTTRHGRWRIEALNHGEVGTYNTARLGLLQHGFGHEDVPGISRVAPRKVSGDS